MKRTDLVILLGLVAHGVAQTQPGMAGYKQSYVQMVEARAAGMTVLRAEPGKPFSATVTNQSTQTFLDGTHVNQTTAAAEYRDAEGRVRIETSEPGRSDSETIKIVTIRDPVARLIYRLDTSQKTVTTSTMPSLVEGAGRSGSAPPGAAVMQPGSATRGEIVEDLGTANINGVPARGTRITTVVPKGAIGNDREFRNTSERWFSPDLNLLVKSVNTDPRFGTSTYELANISRVSPDASLFRVPADYKPHPSPATKVIEGVEFRGLAGVPPDVARAAVHSKAGDVYDEEAVKRDFTALWNLGRFADIQVKTDPGPHGGVVLVFVVSPLR